MKRQQNAGLDFIIDRLTNSSEPVQLGDRFPTEVSLTKSELENIIKKNGWKFNRTGEFKVAEREIYKLTIAKNSNVIQGIVSLYRSEMYFSKTCNDFRKVYFVGIILSKISK